MRLLSCHINHFGNLREESFDFSEGLNSILRENGYGKSMLASFLRVMLYGLSGDGKKNDLDNERRRFLPWEKGSFGGSLDFQYGEKRYRIERSFGTKRSEDETGLYELGTLLPSTDFQEPFGESLFQLNADAFQNTIFIGQEALAVTMSAGIQAKLGTVSSAMEDLKRYDGIRKRIRDEVNHLAPNRKTGEINKLKLAREQQEAKLLKKDGLMKELFSLEEELRQNLVEKRALSLAMRRTNERLHRKVREEQMQQYLREEDRLSQDVEESRRKLRDKEDFFFSGENDPKEERLRGEQRMRELREWNLHFQKRLPGEAELQEQEQELGKFFSLKEELLRTESGFREIQKDRERLDRSAQEFASRRQNLLRERAERQAEEEKALRQRGRHPWLWYLLPSLLCFGIALSALFSRLPRPLISAGLGTVLCLLWYLRDRVSRERERRERLSARDRRVQKEKTEDQELRRQEEQIREERALLAGREKEIRQQIEATEGGMDAIRDDLSDFFRRYRFHFSREEKPGEWQKKLRLIHSGVLRYRLLQEMQELEHDSLQKKKRLERFLAERKEDRSFEEMLEIRGREETKAQESAFSGDSIKTLSDTLTRVTEQLNASENRFKELCLSLDRLRAQAEGLEEVEGERALLQERIQEKEVEYRILEKTRDYLEEARMRIMKKYMAPLTASFAKFYRLLLGKTEKSLPGKGEMPFLLDASLELRLNTEYGQKNPELLSEGFRALTALCKRMSLIEVMYQEEKPFLVMDDPFVNLDPEKLEGAKAFLRELSREYQILYFSCHPSRML